MRVGRDGVASVRRDSIDEPGMLSDLTTFGRPRTPRSGAPTNALS